jgi:peptidoglycan/xylan/chitin deacetylase (PgdA/CDA1 family)
MYKRVEVVIAACLYYSGLVKLAHYFQQRFRRSLVILLYHYAAGGNLWQHMLYLRRHYRILHLEAALEELYTPTKGNHRRGDRRTPLVLSFDDGYTDNYTRAFMLARQLQIPITIFLIPGDIENGHRFWWEEGRHLVCEAQVNEVVVEGRAYHLDRLDERNALSQAIYAHVRHATSVSEREEFLAAMRSALAVPSLVTAQEQATLPLGWREVQEMEASGWVSFGAHTMNHPILAYLSDPVEIEYEVRACREVLEQQLGHPVHTFAYPVGESEHIGENGLRAAQEAGYNWAVTAIPGFNTAQTNVYLLHRLMVDVDQHWLVVAAKASGIWGFFTRLYWMPSTLLSKLLR